MKKSELLKFIIDNGGATLDRNLQPLKASKGYMVSKYGSEEQTSDTKKMIELVLDYTNVISGEEFIGIWYNTDNGIYYIDKSVLITNKKLAIQYGKTQKQLAIYDLAKGESITLDYNIKFYTLYKKIGDDLKAVMQLDTLDEVAREVNKGKNYISKCINEGRLVNDMYLIKCDKMNVGEL